MRGFQPASGGQGGPRQYNRRMSGTPTAGLYTAAQVRELDRCAIERFGVPGYELMTRAGHAALAVLRSAWPQARSVAVLCGPGNNGGDGYVLARLARAQGLRTHVVPLADPAGTTGDARRAYDDFVAAGGHCEAWHPHCVRLGDVVVDALFGTGLTRAIDGLAAEVIAALNECGRPVLALDIPSGLHADTGRPLGVAVRADRTVTFIGRKLGCYLGDGPDWTGALSFEDLGVPPAVYDEVPRTMQLLDMASVAQALPRRARTSHKGRHGHVLIVGGAPGMGGAARLAGEAALRVGAGLVTVAVHPDSLAALAARPELMTASIAAVSDLHAALERATVVALGPGLGQSSWARDVMAAAIAAGQPLVVDADALNLLAQQRGQRPDWVLTPHPGEAARLLGLENAAAVQHDRLRAAAQLQQRYGGTIVLKGAGTIVQGAQHGWICGYGNPGMGTAGMGDVLTGVIAGVAAQCSALELAARAGVFVHAIAGDRAAVHGGERGLLAGDVIDALRPCVNPR
jgi:NAD(P)H-hydrate epimerase